MTYKEEFITFMVRAGVLTFGDFVTKSGRKTPYFINTGNYKTGAQAAQLGDYYAACIQEHLPDGVDCLFGPAYKGIPLAVAAASSLSNCVRVLAGSIGSSLVTTMWERREALHHARLTEGINDYNPVWDTALRALEQFGMTGPQAKAWIANEITRQGFILSFDELFWLGGVLFVLLSGLVWLARRG